MPLSEPSWWYPSTARVPVIARALSPLGRLYGSIAVARFVRAEPYRAPVPVVCVGNFTVGGTGKTPMVRALVGLVRALDREPVVLSRGYGGRNAGPHWVSLETDTADDVGDEPLLLRQDGPVLVSRDRAAGAREIVARYGLRAVVLMDDGLQNPALAKDLTIAVVDARRRFGNGQIFPAGPLRAPLAFQLSLVDAVVVNRAADGSEPWAGPRLEPHGKIVPILQAETRPSGETGWVAGQRILAFAGIANPERVFALLRRLGAELVGTHSFPDHASLTERQARDLMGDADAQSAIIVTTEKDMARMAGRGGATEELRRRVRVIAIDLQLQDAHHAVLTGLLRSALAAPS